jgi:hypothetical protein
MLRSGFKKISLLAVTGVVALLATEAFTRSLMPQNRDTVLDILVPDETVGYIYAAGAKATERGRDYDVPYVINSLGLRDREYDGIDPETFTVLLVGNSFCVSHGLDIEASLSRALERAIVAAFAVEGISKPVRVVNAANAGYNPFNYWKSYARWAPVFKPDAVVVGFVTAREHRCDKEDVRFVVHDGLLRARYRAGEEPVLPRRSPTEVVRKTLARNSDLYVLLRNFFYYSDKMSRFVGGGEGGDGASRLVDPYRKELPARVAEGRSRAFGYLDRLRAETMQDGVSLLVVGIPQKADILEPSWQTALVWADAQGIELDRLGPMSQLAEHCRNAEIPVVDLAPALRAVGADGFFVHDNHWNQHGIAAAAGLVAENWGALGLMPSDIGGHRR